VAVAVPGDTAQGVEISDTAQPQGQVRVLITTGEPLLRAGLRALLEAHAELTVVAEAATFDDAVAEAARVRPDVAVMVATPSAAACVEATRRIRAAADVAVLLLLAATEGDQIFAALRAGARGLLTEDVAPEGLAQAVRVVSRGETLLTPVFAARLVDDFLARPDRLRAKPQLLDELTPREREVVALIASGLSTNEIADRLVVTPATTKTHVNRALRKLGARDRVQLVVLAYESGLVRPMARWWDGGDRAREPRLRLAA
jgi:DNA-binding NarL/FixJ family response regulator